jgi:hypothetical protein
LLALGIPALLVSLIFDAHCSAFGNPRRTIGLMFQLHLVDASGEAVDVVAVGFLKRDLSFGGRTFPVGITSDPPDDREEEQGPPAPPANTIKGNASDIHDAPRALVVRRRRGAARASGTARKHKLRPCVACFVAVLTMFGYGSIIGSL